MMNRAALILFATTMLAAGTCWAFCSEPWPPPVCEEFFDAHKVFIGTVLSSDAEVDKDDFITSYVFTLRVDRDFRNTDQQEIRIYMPNDSGRFEVLQKHKKYLLFAYDRDDGWEIEGCGNSAELDSDGAGRTIAELETLVHDRKPGSGGYVAGNVNTGLGYGEGPPGIRVIARDDSNVYSALTDQHGAFRMHVPAGNYSVQAESKAWRIKEDEGARTAADSVEIEDGKCAVLEFRASKPGEPDASLTP